MQATRIPRWLLVLALLALPAAAQLQTGDLFGTVTDPEGQPLPGVTITVTGVGAPRVAVSDAGGEFRFLGLFPGTYRLEAGLEGFNNVEFPEVGVRLGGQTEVQVAMQAALEETITVTGEAPLLDERRVNRGASVPAAALDQIPTARDPWSLLSLAPGVMVDRVNVGGNESGQQSNFLGLGSSSTENVFAVDGVVLTDMNAVGASATYFDFGAFEEVQLTVSSTDVAIATAGVTINQVTKRGTNDWRGQARYLRTDGEWQSDPALENGNRIEVVEEYGADIGGPIVKDRLWIWGSYGESDIGNVVQGGQLDTTQLEDFNAKVNFQALDSLSGVVHYWTNDKLKFGRGASPTRSPPTTLDQTTPQDIYKLEGSWIPTPNLFVTALWSRDDGIFTLTPQGGLDADISRDENNVWRGTWLDFDQDAIIDQWRVDSHYFFTTGEANHDLKFGGGFREQTNHSGTVWPGGKLVWHADAWGLDPGLAAVGFQRNRSVGLYTSYESAWVQDTLSWDRLTVTAGVRWDHQEGKNLASSDPGDPTVPGPEPGLPGVLPPLDFPGNDAGGFDWDTIVPRVGVTFALGEDRQTLLRGSFSQYAEQLGQGLISRVNPLGYSYVYFYFADDNGNLRLDDNERPSLYFGYGVNLDAFNPGSLEAANVNDPNLDPILTSEVTFGVDRALRSDLGVGLNLTWRRVTDVPDARLLVFDEATGQVRVVDRDDWVLTGDSDPGVLPNGSPGRSKPVFDLREGLSPTGGTFYTNGDRELDYRGITLSLDKRLQDRWSLRGHVTYADTEWKMGPEFRRHDDPTDEIIDDNGYPDDEDVFFEQSGGSNKDDVFVGGSWSFNLSGIYQIAPEQPWGFNVGASVDGREGYVSPTFVNSASGAAVGRRSVEVADIEDFRLDDVIVINGHLDKEIAVGDLDLVLSLDGFNLTNEDVVLQRERDAGEDPDLRYLTVERLSPRVFRAGVTLRFR
jgi:hypothetical protein